MNSVIIKNVIILNNLHDIFHLYDTDVVICIILVLLKRADGPNHYTGSSTVEYEWQDVNFKRRCDWYITIKVSKICNDKIEVVSFVINSGRQLTLGVKFEVNVKK